MEQKEEKENTLIQIRISTWKGLNKRKQNPSESFDHVVQRMLLEFPEEAYINKHKEADENITNILAKQREDEKNGKSI